MLVAGLAAGFLVALLLANLVASQMYGVSPHDPFSFALVSLLLLIISMFACGIAARRAIAIDPVVALRYE